MKTVIPAGGKETHMDPESSKDQLRTLFNTWARHDLACNVQRRDNNDPCNCGLELARGRFKATLGELVHG